MLQVRPDLLQGGVQQLWAAAEVKGLEQGAGGQVAEPRPDQRPVMGAVCSSRVLPAAGARNPPPGSGRATQVRAQVKTGTSRTSRGKRRPLPHLQEERTRPRRDARGASSASVPSCTLSHWDRSRKVRAGASWGRADASDSSGHQLRCSVWRLGSGAEGAARDVSLEHLRSGLGQRV